MLTELSDGGERILRKTANIKRLSDAKTAVVGCRVGRRMLVMQFRKEK